MQNGGPAHGRDGEGDVGTNGHRPMKDQDRAILANGHASGGAEGGSSSRNGVDDDRPLVPVIEERMIPIDHIVSALARQAMRDLAALREAMVDLADQKRKRRLVDYAATYRAEFAKVLVLVNWARRIKGVRTAIDVRAWLQGQKNCFDNLYAVLRYDILNQMQFVKVRAPDIRSAIDVLNTGALPRLRTGVFAQSFRSEPLPLTGGRKDAATQTIDANLTLRLALHETIPSTLQQYSVGGGAATFVVPDEFRIALTSASTDVGADVYPWEYSDFELLGPPGEDGSTHARLKLELRHIVNGILHEARQVPRSQLEAVYERLHRFALFSRLERLASLFRELNDVETELRVEQDSQNNRLSVHYWRSRSDRQGAPFFRISLDASGDRHAVESMHSHGQVEQLTAVAVMSTSARQILDRIVASEVQRLLGNVLVRIQRTPSGTKAFELTSDRDLRGRLSRDGWLSIRISHGRGTWQVRTTTGVQLQECAELGKVLAATIDAERQADAILQFVRRDARRGVVQAASLTGWSELELQHSSIDKAGFARATGFTLDQAVFLTRRQSGWLDCNGGSAWFAVSIMLEGAWSWHIAEATVVRNVWQLDWFDRLDIPLITPALEGRIDPLKFYEALNQLCTGRIITLQVQRGLTERGTISQLLQDEDKQPYVSIATRDLTGVHQVSWLAPLLKIVLARSYATDSLQLVLVLTPALASSIDVSMLLRSGLLVQTRHGLSICVPCSVQTTPKELVDALLDGWQKVQALVAILLDVVEVPQLADAQFKNANQVELRYGQDRQNALTLGLGLAESITVNAGQLYNPHARIETFLRQLGPFLRDNVIPLAGLLAATEPVLSLFDRLERATADDPAFYIVARSAISYRIYYTRSRHTIDVKLRCTDGRAAAKTLSDRVYWQISEYPVRGHTSKLPCRSIFERGLDDVLGAGTTTPLQTGLRCRSSVVVDAVIQIHNVLGKANALAAPAGKAK